MRIKLLLVILSGLIIQIIIHFMGCNDGGPCCPKLVDSLKVSPEWVCPMCPDAGTRLFYKIAFLKQKEDGIEPCEPSNKILQLKNITEGKILTNNYFVAHKTISGVYENPTGGAWIMVNKKSKIELLAVGENGCDTVKDYIEIKVVEKGSYQDLCFPYTDPQAGSLQGSWTGQTNIFGTGVVVDSIANMNTNKVMINVTHNGITAMNVLYRSGSVVHKGLPANGQWTLEISNTNDYQKFIQSGEKSLCVRVYLGCKCQ